MKNLIKWLKRLNDQDKNAVKIGLMSGFLGSQKTMNFLQTEAIMKIAESIGGKKDDNL